MLDSFYHSYIMELIDPFLFMQLRGVLVDQERRQTIRDKLIITQQEAVKRLEIFTGGTNIMGAKTISNQKLAKLLYDDLKLPKVYHPKTGKVTTNEDALNKLAAKVSDDKRDAFNDVLTVRDIGVLVSTFLDVTLDCDNRLRCSYNIAGTETGRLSSSGSPWWTGTNMQNWEDGVREIVIADPGHIFVYADGEQAEARVVAWLAQDSEMMKVFDSGLDVHCLMAALIFGIDYKILLKGYEDNDPYYVDIRYLAKRTVHANNYKMGIRKFATLIGKPESEARRIQNRYFATFPSLKSKFHLDIERRVNKTRELHTPFGRRRQFFGRMDDELYRAAVACVPQSTIADWLDIGLLRLWRWTQGQFTSPSSIMSKYLDIEATTKTKFVPNRLSLKLPIRPAIQIHDGLLCQVPIKLLKEAIPAIKECLTYEVPFDVGPLTVPVDIKVGFRWTSNKLCVDGLKKATPAWIDECMKAA